ncbi:hypothetical protein BR93DRAFT_933808 [Coniochaeta sp. PMI_546]|nr:hypothetical protein BR93DRAFT_933808 [Coniochaeta sp. PMI_546]
MDRNLKCNVFGCDAELKEEAFVTTCSHIYCCDCAARTGLTSEDRSQRVCPACKTQLPNQYDVFQNYLNPAEDWKTNVLGGLSPSIIMECAGKALSFWGYQMAMEMAFLEGANRRLTVEYELMVSKYEKELSNQKATLDRQATEIENKRAEIEDLQQTNENLGSALKEKGRKLTQTEELYQKIKRKAMLEEIEHIEVYSTPQTHRHRAPGTTSMGLPNVQGLVAGTPRGTPKGTSRVNTDLSKGHLDPRQPQKPPIRFSGVGLGPGVAGLGGSRHTMIDTGATNYDSLSAPSISSRVGFRDNRAPQATAFTQNLAGQRHGAIAGSRGYGRM